MYTADEVRYPLRLNVQFDDQHAKKMLIKAKYNETVTTITSKEQSPATHLLYIRLMYSKRGARKNTTN